MSLQFAVWLAVIAFAARAAQGVLEGADFQGTIESGLWIAAAFYILGAIAGEFGRRVAEEGARQEFARRSQTVPTEK